MGYTLDRLPVEYINKSLCGYCNSTDKVQVVRISNIPSWYLERVVFPYEYCLFEAPITAELEVYQEGYSTPELLKKLPCDRLQVEENLTVKTPTALGSTMS